MDPYQASDKIWNIRIYLAGETSEKYSGKDLMFRNNGHTSFIDVKTGLEVRTNLPVWAEEKKKDG